MKYSISGNVVDIFQRKTYPATLTILDDKIIDIIPIDEPQAQYILLGFIDAHIHIESSMLTPYEFGKIAVKHGTVGTISDPHEIANVCGLEGVQYMIEDARHTPLKIHFGAPSCVPATIYENAGATLDATAVRELMSSDDIYYLSEVMNFPGVMNSDAELIAKINAAKQYNKPIDGHAPGVRWPEAVRYFNKGITTDHECFTLEEALDKVALDVNILIREGSAAKNFEALHPLLRLHPKQVMLCSDDKHPDDLIDGHINLLVRKAVALGYDVYDVLYAACIHPVLHYKMRCGMLRVGDSADFIVVEDLSSFEVLQTFIDGKEVFNKNCPTENDSYYQSPVLNNFSCKPVALEELIIYANDKKNRIKVNVIEALDGQLITKHLKALLPIVNGIINNDLENDILKIVVVNRYNNNTRLQVGFIKNFGFKNAAIGSTVAHDSHNIIAVGSDDTLIAKAINALITTRGGIVFCNNDETELLPLPIAGLMSNEDAYEVSHSYQSISQKAKVAGCTLTAPFMTLSFMALPVIPELKITDACLFATSVFKSIELFGG